MFLYCFLSFTLKYLWFHCSTACFVWWFWKTFLMLLKCTSAQPASASRIPCALRRENARPHVCLHYEVISPPDLLSWDQWGAPAKGQCLTDCFVTRTLRYLLRLCSFLIFSASLPWVSMFMPWQWARQAKVRCHWGAQGNWQRIEEGNDHLLGQLIVQNVQYTDHNAPKYPA